METLIKINVNEEIINITSLTPFPLLLSEFLYEGDFDLMLADLKNKKEFIAEAKKVDYLTKNIPGLTSSFITRPFVFNDFLTYMEEFKISTSDFNHVSLNGLFDIVLDRADKKDFEIVEKIVQFMLKIDHNFAPAYEMLGSIYIEEGDFDKGKEYLEKAMKMDPWNVAALSELGEAYFNLGDYDKAAVIWKKEIELSPDNYVTYFMITDAYMELGKANKAASVMEKFLNRFPKSILGKHQLSRLYEKLNRNLESDKLKSEIVSSIPEYSSDIEIWAKLMYENKKFDKVDKFINKYVEKHPTEEHFRLLLLVPYLKEKNIEKAKTLYYDLKEKYSWYLYSLKDVLAKHIEKDLLDEMYL